MTGTSNTNNQGIMHLVRSTGGTPVCNSRRAIMATTADRFATDPKPCKRCASLFAKWQAKRAVKAQNATVAAAVA